MVDQTKAQVTSSRRNDDALTAYLAEFGDSSRRDPTGEHLDDEHIEVLEAAPIVRSASLFSSQTIPREKRIAPTILVERNPQNKRARQQTESLLVLLQYLHFLNHPLSPALRSSFLTAAEKSIEDYRAAGFCALSVASCSGVVSEVAG